MEDTGMSKRQMLFLAVAVGISAGYDFYRGYHQTRSVGGGIVYVILGLVVFGVLLVAVLQAPKFALSDRRVLPTLDFGIPLRYRMPINVSSLAIKKSRRLLSWG
jgi:hypothetical protein